MNIPGPALKAADEAAALFGRLTSGAVTLQELWRSFPFLVELAPPRLTGFALRWNGNVGDNAGDQIHEYSLLVCFESPVILPNIALRLLVPFAPMELRLEARFGSFHPLAGSRVRPVAPGLDIGAKFPGEISSGTLGAIVKRADRTGQSFLLSANHVISLNHDPPSPSNRSIAQPPGQLQPAAFDANVIAVVDDLPGACRLSGNRNIGDFALARLLDPTGFQTSWPAEMPALRRIAPLQAKDAAGRKVFKNGAATGVTRGIVRTLKTTFFQLYPIINVTFGFIDQLSVEDLPGGGPFASPGDSGSLVVTDTGEPVGLVFADGPTSTVVCPLDTLFAQLGLSFA